MAQRFVTVGGKILDLTDPPDADAFLIIMRSYGQAAHCEWGAEYILACATAARADYDSVQQGRA